MKTLKAKISKILIILLSILLVLIAIGNLYLAIRNDGVVNSIIIDVILLFWAYNIFRQRRWALNLLVLALFSFAILLLGVFSPFTASDYMALGKEAPSVSTILLWLIPLEILLLVIIYFINPSKKKA